jgi:hypothetical protein
MHPRNDSDYDSPPANPFVHTEGERSAEVKAESKHLRFTCAQLLAAVRAGTEPHPGRTVLCADGWLTFED